MIRFCSRAQRSSFSFSCAERPVERRGMGTGKGGNFGCNRGGHAPRAKGGQAAARARKGEGGGSSTYIVKTRLVALENHAGLSRHRALPWAPPNLGFCQQAIHVTARIAAHLQFAAATRASAISGGH